MPSDSSLTDFNSRALTVWWKSMGPAISLLTGGLLMGIAPVNAWPLAWVALVPLWRLVLGDELALRPALAGAALWGVAYHGVALSWIVWWLNPLLVMGLPWIAGVFLALFAWAFITLWGAAIGVTWLWLMRMVMRWYGARARGNGLALWQRLLLGTALWCAVEWVWSRGPLYWTSLSYTQSPGDLWILQMGQISGPITVTAAIVIVNGLLAVAMTPSGLSSSELSSSELSSSELSFSRASKRSYVIGVVGLFVCLHLAGGWLYSRPLADTPEQSLRVGLIQGNIPTSQKLSPEGVRTSIQAYLTGYEQLAAEGAELVITPEGAIPQRWNAFTEDRNVFVRAVANTGVPLILGSFAHREIADTRSPLTQSLLTLTAAGQIESRYNKVKLVPLGEYLPFAHLLDRLSPFESLAPGTFDQQLNTPFGPVAAGICYESAFTELFRQQVKRGGQLILTASNNDPYPPRQMMQHHALDVMRAIESDRWEARVTNTGISGIVDPRGRTQWLSNPDEQVTHQAKIYRRQTLTPYVRWGDWLTPTLLILAAIGLGK
ncbi:MAG: apolipoprotein N-acyltransferase [Cyanobacteria bacterium J06623_5]